MKINKEYNFSFEVKKEICSFFIQEIQKFKNIDYLFLGLFKSIADIAIIEKEFCIELETQNLNLVKLLKTRFKNEDLIIFKSNKKTLKYNNFKFKIILKNLNNNFKNYSSFLVSNKEIKFSSIKQEKLFLIGCFLASGSVSNPVKNSYHLEIRISNNEVLLNLFSILKNLKIDFHQIEHKNKEVIYVKKSEHVSDLLKIFNAFENMYNFEEFRIEKDFFNSLQRVNNLEFSNLQKLIKSNQEMIKIISFLKETKEFEKLNENIQIYCELRLKFPEYSMNDLVIELNKVLDKPVTKSWINHTNIKLKKIYKLFR